jgi:hypothetical protein
MHLVQILLPVYDNDKQPFDLALFDQVEQELTHAFGGVTAYLRSPAEGSWKRATGEVNYDQIVVFEVMAERLDPIWWRSYCQELEKRFRQDKVIARASQIRLL